MYGPEPTTSLSSLSASIASEDAIAASHMMRSSVGIGCGNVIVMLYGSATSNSKSANLAFTSATAVSVATTSSASKSEPSENFTPSRNVSVAADWSSLYSHSVASCAEGLPNSSQMSRVSHAASANQPWYDGWRKGLRPGMSAVIPSVRVDSSPALCPEPPAGAQAVNASAVAATTSGSAAKFRMRCMSTPLLDSLGRREPTRPVTDAVVVSAGGHYVRPAAPAIF